RGLRTRNNHICGRTFGSTVRLPQWYQSLNYKEQREGIIGMIGSKRNSSNMTLEPNQPVFNNLSKLGQEGLMTWAVFGEQLS
ncbi:hypothetical protein PIB30_108549, partial [Stylosanthes scabra]|nr:hypothetical protein [Stylosanthes scabra]